MSHFDWLQNLFSSYGQGYTPDTKSKEHNDAAKELILDTLQRHKQNNEVLAQSGGGYKAYAAESYRKHLIQNLNEVCYNNPDVVINMIVNNPDNLSERDLETILNACSASLVYVSRDKVGRNKHYVTRTLRTYYNDLPRGIQQELDWLERVHGY